MKTFFLHKKKIQDTTNQIEDNCLIEPPLHFFISKNRPEKKQVKNELE